MKTAALYTDRYTRPMLAIRLIVCAVLLSCAAPPLWAQTGDSVKIRSLREVMIISGLHSLIDTSGTPVQQLKGKELERLNSLSVADAVRYFSGVQLKDYGGVGGLKTVNVRSLGSNHTAVFYDGVELGNAQNGQVDLGKFSLDNIEEIALYDGQKSSIFQPASGFAAASSLYLTARQPIFNPGSNSNEKFTVKTGSFGLFNPSALWQYKLTDNIYSTLSTEWTTANGRYKFSSSDGVYDTTAVRKNADIDAQRIEAGLNGRLKDSSAWSAKFYWYNSQRGLPIAIVSNNFGADTARQRLWDRDIFVQAGYHKDAKAYSFMVNAKYTADYERFLDPTMPTTTGFTNNLFTEHQLYLSVAQLYRPRSWWNVSLSGDWLYNSLSANLYHFVYPTRNTFLNALATEIHSAGFNLQANLLSTIVNDEVRQYTGAGNKNQLTPAILLSWKPFRDQNFRIRSFYKDIFRMPTFNDLYYTEIGNAFLKPEYARQYDLGITYDKVFPNSLLTLLSVQTDAYFNRVTNKIIAVPGVNLFRWSMENLGIVNVKGLEVNARALWRFSSELTVHTGISYTYEQSLDMDPGEDYKQLIPYAPLNSASLLISGDWRHWSLNYSYIYTGARYDEEGTIPANYLQPWYTHDLAINYTMLIHRQQLKAGLEVNNLLNQTYEVILD